MFPSIARILISNFSRESFGEKYILTLCSRCTKKGRLRSVENGLKLTEVVENHNLLDTFFFVFDNGPKISGNRGMEIPFGGSNGKMFKYKSDVSDRC